MLYQRQWRYCVPLWSLPGNQDVWVPVVQHQPLPSTVSIAAPAQAGDPSSSFPLNIKHSTWHPVGAQWFHGPEANRVSLCGLIKEPQILSYWQVCHGVNPLFWLPLL